MKNRLIDLLISLACETLDPPSLDELSYSLHKIAQEAMDFHGGGGGRGRYERGGRGGFRGGGRGGFRGGDDFEPPRGAFRERGRGSRGRGPPDERASDRHPNPEAAEKPAEHRDPNTREGERANAREGERANMHENPDRRGRGFRARNHHRPRRN